MLLHATEVKDHQKLAPSYLAFKRGEKLDYIIHYGPINAGKATFTVKDTLLSIDGRKHYMVKVFGRSIKTWDWIYKVRDHYYTFMDTTTLLPSVGIRDVYEGGYAKKEKMVFNRDKNIVTSNGVEHEVPDNIHDILSAIYYARCIDFSDILPGTFIPINTFFEDSLFPVGVTYKGIGELNTKLGDFKCRIFQPQLIKGRIFKGQQDMTVYVSDDKNQLPIRVESEIFVGKIQADLVEYQNLKFPLSSKRKE